MELFAECLFRGTAPDVAGQMTGAQPRVTGHASGMCGVCHTPNSPAELGSCVDQAPNLI